ncbi:MAG: sigma-54-dependent Fis family transcriptional regulator [Candidatus Aureabacteria bacterium]|nr:sigma-54-dependent Fis family transcriptional regulator [Candidatus Auribacterota bacterium]
MTPEMKQEYVISKLFSLLQASQEVSSTRDKAKLLESIVLSATKVIECKNSCLMLLHPESQELVAHVIVGDDKQVMREVRFKVGEGIAGWVAKHAEAVLSNNVQSDPRYSKKLDEITDMPLQSILCLPLVSKGKMLGVLNIINKPEGGRFTEEDLHLAQAFAAQAAIAIDNANLYDAISNENKLLRDQLDLAPKLLVSFNPKMKEIIEMGRRAAESDATVLLLGESGTGKEIVARAIHTWSDRKTCPFVALNCAALPEQLIESEIFGHEQGAFTGAVRRKVGKVELANGGTLFVDEIGELKLDVQTKLLRVLQEHQFERVGGTEVITADIRIIAATNKDLREEIQKGAFREDLFFRLNVISLTIPPLRERKEDILFIANNFIQRYCAEEGRHAPTISSSGKKALLGYDWPGNVRELENVLERAIVLGEKDTIDADNLLLDLSLLISKPIDLSRPYRELVKGFKRDIIKRALDECGGNQSRAAEKLSLTQPRFSRLMKDLGLR